MSRRDVVDDGAVVGSRRVDGVVVDVQHLVVGKRHEGQVDVVVDGRKYGTLWVMSTAYDKAPIAEATTAMMKPLTAWTATPN